MICVFVDAPRVGQIGIRSDGNFPVVALCTGPAGAKSSTVAASTVSLLRLAAGVPAPQK